MLKKTRKLLIGLVLLAAIFCSESNVSASILGQNGANLIDLQSVNTAGSRLGFSISNTGTANISAGVVGKAGTSKIQLNVKLQKYNSGSKSWKLVKNWEKTFGSANASMNPSYKLDSKGTYRCILSANVWKNGNEEKISMTSDKKKY